jgi:hypothetical protein
MTRVSAEVRRAQQRQEHEAAETQRKIAAAEFKLRLPHVLLLLAARIQPFGEAIVKPNGENDYHVEFRFHDRPMENVSLGTESEEWAVDSLRSAIEGFELDARLRAEKVQVAREGWASLTPAQQRAMIDLGIARQP